MDKVDQQKELVASKPNNITVMSNVVTEVLSTTRAHPRILRTSRLRKCGDRTENLPALGQQCRRLSAAPPPEIGRGALWDPIILSANKLRPWRSLGIAISMVPARVSKSRGRSARPAERFAESLAPLVHHVELPIGRGSDFVDA
jgi:hypothetical protein